MYRDYQFQRNNNNNNFNYNNKNNNIFDQLTNSKKHMNTVFLKEDMRMSRQPYQALKKHISYQNYFNPNFNDKSLNQQQQLQQSILQVEKYMKGQVNIDKDKLKDLDQITLAPVINHNFMSSFNQNQYQLNPEDKVKIVKEKVFKVQNYYNYLYELETKKKINEINQKAKQLLNVIKKPNKLENKPNESKLDSKNNDNIKEMSRMSWKQPVIDQRKSRKYLQSEFKNTQEKDLFTSILKQKQKNQIQERFSGYNKW